MLAYQIPKANTSFFLLGDQGNLLKYDYKNILQIFKLIYITQLYPLNWVQEHANKLDEYAKQRSSHAQHNSGQLSH